MKTFAIVILLFILTPITAQVNRAEITGAYIVNLAKYITWPNENDIQKTFTDSDFQFQDGVLIISSTKNIISLDDLKEKDLPVIEFERNASKATKLDGYRGRGIVLRISPKGNMPGETSKANTLTLTYDQAMS